ncbi:MAG: hypothetical protein E7672_09105 [Ruminococcaceae bacterium]|nr:hypothetical protein [Oscillospiraceae bacterium]
MSKDFSIKKFQNAPDDSRPMIRWWIPGAMVDKDELTREIISMKNAGFKGAEVAPSNIIAPKNRSNRIKWNTDEWTDVLRHILTEAAKLDFQIDLTMTQNYPMGLPTVTDVNDPKHGALWELDGAWIDGITKEKGYSGPVPINEDAMQDIERANGTMELYAVTAAKYTDRDKHILSYDSARVLEPDVHIKKTGDGLTDYTVTFIPEDDGEYVLYAWWAHPTGATICTFNVIDHLGKYGTKMLTDYYEKIIFPALGDTYKLISSLFIDSLEFISHLDYTIGFKEMFIEKNGYDFTKYLPAVYDNDNLGLFDSAREPDFSFDKNNSRLVNSYDEFITHLYIENHLKPLAEFCDRHGMSLRYQTTYGKFFELAKTAGYVHIPETETLYGGDIIDFYRLQSGTAHILKRPIYSIETAAESNKRGNGTESSGNYEQTIKNLMWHTQRAFAAGVNLAVFHGYNYNGHYHGEGNENGCLPGIVWPGLDVVGSDHWSNNWNERQPNWLAMDQVTDYLARVQYFLQCGTPKIDLAVYRHSYFETIDFNGPEKIINTSLLEQAGFTYDFLSPSHFTDYEVEFDGNALFPNGPAYKALIINDQTDLPYDFATKLDRLTDDGLSVVFCGKIPADSAFFNEDGIDQIVQKMMSKDNVHFCDDIDKLPDFLKTIGILPDAMNAGYVPVLNLRRSMKNMEGFYFYHYADADTFPDLKNAEDVHFSVSLKASGIPYLLDLWNGSVDPIKNYTVENGRITVELDAYVNDSFALLVVDPDADDEINDIISAQTDARAIIAGAEFELKNWALTVESWLPGDSPVHTMKKEVISTNSEDPILWTSLDGMEYVSGVGHYRAEFSSDKGWEDGYGAYLAIDEIEDSYIVKVNGKKIAADQIHSFVDIGKEIKKGKNEVEIIVTSTLLNALLAHKNANNIIDFLGVPDNRKPKPHGISGKVRIIPYKRADTQTR